MRRILVLATVLAFLPFGQARLVAQPNEPLYKEPINVVVPHVSTDKSVRYDYDIVYVRARRAGDEIHKRFYTDIATPVTLIARLRRDSKRPSRLSPTTRCGI